MATADRNLVGLAVRGTTPRRRRGTARAGTPPFEPASSAAADEVSMRPRIRIKGSSDMNRRMPATCEGAEA